VLGFGMMAISFLAMALKPGIEKLLYPLLAIYGLSYFLTEIGPNSTMFVYPAELFPSEGRSTRHGIASAAGKVGGFAGVFTFPLLTSWHGLLTAEPGGGDCQYGGIAGDGGHAAGDDGAEAGGVERGTRKASSSLLEK
jgi:hypothetical protein